MYFTEKDNNEEYEIPDESLFGYVLVEFRKYFYLNFSNAFNFFECFMIKFDDVNYG